MWPEILRIELSGKVPGARSRSQVPSRSTLVLWQLSVLLAVARLRRSRMLSPSSRLQYELRMGLLMPFAKALDKR
jgi:hypothetical protein